MSYYFSKIVDNTFDDAVEKVTANLKEQGFGVLTQIDVKETLKNKLDVDFKRYKILGACNPPFAYRALKAEDKIGVMLPCNIIVIDQGEGKTEVSAVNPMTSMSAVNNKELESIAAEVSGRLQQVVQNL